MAGENTKIYLKQGGDELVVASGGKITNAGTQAVAVTNASVAHALNATFSDTEAEAALNALGTKLNSVIAALRGVGVIAP